MSSELLFKLQNHTIGDSLEVGQKRSSPYEESKIYYVQDPLDRNLYMAALNDIHRDDTNSAIVCNSKNTSHCRRRKYAANNKRISATVEVGM